MHARAEEHELLASIRLTRELIVVDSLVVGQLLWRPCFRCVDCHGHLGRHAIRVLRGKPCLTLHVDRGDVDALFYLAVAVDVVRSRTTDVVRKLVARVRVGNAAILSHVLRLELATWEAVENLLVSGCRRARDEALIVEQYLDRRCVDGAQRHQLTLEVVLRCDDDAVIDQVAVDDVSEPLREREAHALVWRLKECLNSGQLVAVLVTCVRGRLRRVRQCLFSHDLLDYLRREAPRPVKADKSVLHDLNTTLHDVNVFGESAQHRPRNTSVDQIDVGCN